MFFGKSRKRKSNVVSSPEYNEYEEQDNRQDIYDLQERMKKHGFEGGPGSNKDRWIYDSNVFDFDRPYGGAQEAWSISDEDYSKLQDLLDRLDKEKENETENDDYANAVNDVTTAANQLAERFKTYDVDVSDVVEELKNELGKLPTAEKVSYNKSWLLRNLRKDGNRKLNTYADLIKNNPDVFFAFEKSVPKDALNDYEENENSKYYFDIDDMSDWSADDFRQIKEDYANSILNDHREANELAKQNDKNESIQNMLRSINDVKYW